MVVHASFQVMLKFSVTLHRPATVTPCRLTVVCTLEPSPFEPAFKSASESSSLGPSSFACGKRFTCLWLSSAYTQRMTAIKIIRGDSIGHWTILPHRSESGPYTESWDSPFQNLCVPAFRPSFRLICRPMVVGMNHELYFGTIPLLTGT